MSEEARDDEKKTDSAAMEMVKQYLPVAVVALLCIWGYVDLKAEIDRLGTPDQAGAVEPPATAESPEASVGKELVPPAVEEQPSTERAVDWECTGSVKQEKVIETVGKYGTAVFDCYKEVLRNTPDLRGTLVLEINVGRNGEVREARVKGPIQDATMLGCVSDSVYKWTFTSPVEGDCAIVSVPFMLDPAEHGAVENQPPAGGPPM